MDIGKIGLLVGVLALILAVPLAVLANMVTPRVTAWWSTTSRARIKRRIAKLVRLLDAIEGQWTFTPAEWRAYEANYQIALAVLFMVQPLLAALMAILLQVEFLLMQVPASKGIFPVGQILLFVLLLFLMALSAAAATILATRRYARDQRHTSEWRIESREEINKLRALLGEPSILDEVMREAAIVTKMHEDKDKQTPH